LTTCTTERCGSCSCGLPRRPSVRPWRNSPTCEASFSAPGTFVVRARETSQGILEIYVDEKCLLRDPSLNVLRKKIQKDFAIDVPAGRHEIRLDNAGGDWIDLEHLLVTNFRNTSQHSDLDVWGLRSDDLILLWIHNRLSQWAFKAAAYDAEPAGFAGMTLEGPYAVEWWDTYKGEFTKTDETLCLGGWLHLGHPPVDIDLACKMCRYRGVIYRQREGHPHPRTSSLRTTYTTPSH